MLVRLSSWTAHSWKQNATANEAIYVAGDELDVVAVERVKAF